MAYEFKKLSDVEVVETPTDTANILIEEDGVIKKAPKTAVGGAGGDTEWDAILTSNGTPSQAASGEWTLLEFDFDLVKNKICSGELPRILIRHEFSYGGVYVTNCVVFSAQYNESSDTIYLAYIGITGTSYRDSVWLTIGRDGSVTQNGNYI